MLNLDQDLLRCEGRPTDVMAPATYRSLLVLAEQPGFEAIQPALRQSLDEEEKMAAWILENLQDLTL